MHIYFTVLWVIWLVSQQPFSAFLSLLCFSLCFSARHIKQRQAEQHHPQPPPSQMSERVGGISPACRPSARLSSDVPAPWDTRSQSRAETAAEGGMRFHRSRNRRTSESPVSRGVRHSLLVRRVEGCPVLRRAPSSSTHRRRHSQNTGQVNTSC